MTIRHIFATLLVLLASVVSACGESTAPTSRDTVGTYEIVGINGKRPPVALADSLTIVSSVMVLGADNSYRETITYNRFGVETAATFDGIYSSDGKLVIVQASGGFTFDLYVQDRSTLIENDSNGIIIYRKR